MFFILLKAENKKGGKNQYENLKDNIRKHMLKL